VLRDDSVHFHAKLGAAGVETRLSAIAGMEHVAVVRGLGLPGAAETFEEAVQFITQVLGR
jgi:acetyl esterase/lipase